MIAVTEYRRGRNYIRLGDRVRIRPTPGRRNGFDAIVHGIRIDESTGAVREVDVFGGRAGRAMFRTFRPDGIERLAATAAPTGPSGSSDSYPPAGGAADCLMTAAGRRLPRGYAAPPSAPTNPSERAEISGLRSRGRHPRGCDQRLQKPASSSTMSNSRWPCRSLKQQRCWESREAWPMSSLPDVSSTRSGSAGGSWFLGTSCSKCWGLVSDPPWIHGGSAALVTTTDRGGADLHEARFVGLCRGFNSPAVAFEAWAAAHPPRSRTDDCVDELEDARLEVDVLPAQTVHFSPSPPAAAVTRRNASMASPYRSRASVRMLRAPGTGVGVGRRRDRLAFLGFGHSTSAAGLWRIHRRRRAICSALLMQRCTPPRTYLMASGLPVRLFPFVRSCR